MIRCNDIYIDYERHGETIKAVRGVSLDVNNGNYIALVGPAGSGKSTLLSSITGLLAPQKGEVFIDKYSIYKTSRRKRAKIRANSFGIIFQFSELINRFTIYENLKLAWMTIHGSNKEEQFQQRLKYLCDRLQMTELLNLHPHRVSGGQLQKGAIARALIKDTPYIVADEPSGDLDPENIEKVRNLFKEENENGKLIFLVTHDMKLAFDAQTIFELKNGKITKLIKDS